jgi:heme oxygenase
MQSSEPGPPRGSTLRESLRAATGEIHALLHQHTGFAAIQNGSIDLAAYRALILRLYGFYAPFEAAVGIGSERSTWLLQDLAAVGINGATMATIPRCTALTAFDTPGRRLGALYVVEGSTLGGRHLARHLDSLFGSEGSAGRRFFIGRGAHTSAAWNAFLAQLSSSAGATAARMEIVAAAVRTFSIFHEWLNGWRNLST